VDSFWKNKNPESNDSSQFVRIRPATYIGIHCNPFVENDIVMDIGNKKKQNNPTEPLLS
jgi:hypothetical protein